MQLPSALRGSRASSSAGHLRVLVGLALLMAGSLVGCRSTPPPTFSAYWTSGRQISPCPTGRDCVAYRTGRKQFLYLIQERRREMPKLELVDFDARISSDGEIYAGVWSTSAVDHRFRMGLTWKEFLSEHRQRSHAGDQLVNLEVYSDDASSRVAAIWRPGAGSPADAARVVHDLDWTALLAEDRRMQKRGLHLAEIEVYPRPGDPGKHFAAGVWTAGEDETALLTDRPCNLQSQVEPALGPGGLDARYLRCDLLLELENLNRQGFRPVDFEPYYTQSGERWAVLLRRRGGPDWLSIRSPAEDINQRNVTLNSPSGVGNGTVVDTRFTILDLDLPDVPFEFHEGVSHDGGTSGPP